VFSLSLIFPSSQILAKNQCSCSTEYSSSQILANTTVHTQPHSPLISDTRNYESLHSALYSLHFRYLQLPVIALNLIIPFSLIIVNAIVSGQPHILLLSGTCACQCSRSASYCSPLRYLQLLMFALSIIFPFSQILATTSVCAQPHISPLIYSQIPKCSHVMCIYIYICYCLGSCAGIIVVGCCCCCCCSCCCCCCWTWRL
jgi:hypothetical protein